MRNSGLEPNPLSQLHLIERNIDGITNHMSANFTHIMTGSGTQVEEENSSPEEFTQLKQQLKQEATFFHDHGPSCEGVSPILL
jgi:hypothetical protein